jgi:predicted MFS family arabinose efflux permease
MDLGASILQIGLILSVQSFLSISMRLPLTILGQKIGEDKMLNIAFIVQATAPILFFIAKNPIWLFPIIIYQNIATGSFQQLSMSLASNLAPSDRQGDALGRYMTFHHMGMFIGPIITSVLIVDLSYRQLYLVTSIFPTIGLILLRRYTKGIGRQSLSLIQEPKQNVGAFGSLKLILRDRNIRILSIVRTCYSLSYKMFTTLFAVYAVQQLKFSPSTAAFFFSVIGFANVAVRFPVGKISDKIGDKFVLLATLGIVILDYIAISNSRSFIPIIILLIVYGGCQGARNISEWSILAKTVSAETKTLAMSYLITVWFIGSALGSMMGGVLAESQSFSKIFLLSAVINIPALFSIFTLRVQEKT